ncbi:hypothetical protein R1flu_011099 [Riccia fluitans]|uniref:Telomere length regulation protein conserved domain-containing protein n=1 Tax=Riccia fluitans TaxID=41844 RepID=A0ABD1Z6V4_9MARC
MESVEDAIQELLKAVLQNVHEAEDVHVVTNTLSVVASLLWSPTANGNSGSEHSDSSVSTSLDQVAALYIGRATMAQPDIPWREILNRVFFVGQAFSIFAQFLLKEIAVHWLACFSLAEQKSLFDDFFTRAPPSEVLLELVPALSQGYIVTENDKGSAFFDEDDVPEASAGDDVQAVIRFQAERLLVLILIRSKGVREIALSLSSTSDKLPGVSFRTESRFLSVSTSTTEIAQLLSSIPDRASLHAPLALQSPDYFQGLTEQVLAAAEEKWKSYPESNYSKSLVDDPTLKFVGEVLAKLSRRGYAGIVAAQVLPPLVQHVIISSSEEGIGSDSSEISDKKLDRLLERLHCSFWPSLAAGFNDSYALERLTELLLKQMASRRDLKDWEAYCILQAFYGKLFRVQIAARALFTEKLLLTKILPVRCLRWVLAIAVLCSPPSSSPRSKSRITRKDVVKRLVEAWAAKEFVQSTPVQQQAYVTAAVGMCLESMNKDDLEDIGGFVQLLLKGISNRLDSPLLPVRQMGKRIALAFSLAMDSGKPLLLDEEDNIEDLQNWEGLEELVRGILKSEAPRIEIRGAMHTNKLTNLPEDKGELHQVGNGDAPKSEEPRRRREKKQRLAVEEDDPDAVVRLDEGFSFEESDISSESESESESDLVPYDIPEESEGSSKVKAPTQLYDCASYLRKEDDPDMVEKALEVVGRLVMEMPEELDQHSADLAHALLQVKCSSVAVEGEEAVAEKRQRNALVALLACSPVNTVTALTSQLFSPHIDISQRLLILEVMAAGARAIANGLYRKKIPDDKRNMHLISDITGLESLSWEGPGSAAGPRGAGPWKEVSTPLLGDRFVGWGTSYERELPRNEGAKVVGRSRKWGLRSMQLREAGRMQGLTGSEGNPFASLAPMFMLPVMKEYDVKRHGVDLLGRDYFVLGAMLSMLAECMKCIPLQPEAALLGSSLLDLLRSRQISFHKEPFVRRAALYAASCVMGALNPTDVVSSLTGGVGNMTNNLEWIREWALDVANNDSDKECSVVAMACLQLHSEMAMQAIRSMGTSALPEEIFESKVHSASSSAPILVPSHSSSPGITLEP